MFNHLQTYYKVVNGIYLDEEISQGDYVQLKSHHLLQKRYAKCMSDPESVGKIYAYVLHISSDNICSSTDISSGSTLPLGKKSNMKIAVDDEDRINVRLCDSRIFRKANNPVIPSILKLFIDDQPNGDFHKEGSFVRSRAGVIISVKGENYKMTSSFGSGSEYILPLLVLSELNDKNELILATSK